MLRHILSDVRRLILILIFGSIFAAGSVFAIEIRKNEQKKNIDPAATEQWAPVPPVIRPEPVPSDALVLFDGRSFDQWVHTDGRAVEWTLQSGVATIKPGTGAIATKDVFCDMQLHIEWRVPKKIKDKQGQKLGNSGIFLQGRYEIQILDSYKNTTYVNGQAGSVYKQAAPLVNAMNPEGMWQRYNIIYKAPKFSGKTLSEPAYITVLHNDVLIQNHFKVQGRTVNRGQPQYHAHGCDRIILQDHNDLVSFRNIWVRKL